MTEKLTTYLCSEKSGKMDYEDLSDIDGIEVANGLVETKLWPETSSPGCQANAGKIIAPLLREGNSRHACPNGDFLDWYREEILSGDEPVGLRHYITIEVENSGHCHWFYSFVMIYGADLSIHGRMFGRVEVAAGGGPAPEDKADVFSGGGKTYFHVLQNTIVPGELISLEWTFWDTKFTDEVYADSKWYCTCCYTGGKVISINGDYGDTDITYTVSIQGTNRTCVSSDFVEYEVDDWVFVLIPNSSCETCGRKTSCKAGCRGEGGVSWIISTDYLINDICKKGLNIYTCLQNHTSSEDDEPGVGINWSSYWQLETTDPEYIILPLKVGDYGL